jgi:hypothetical protein
MTERYVVGDVVTVQNTFAVDSNGTFINTDPTNVTLAVTDPDAGATNYTNGSLTNSATGVWQTDYTAATNGVYSVTWTGDSPAADTAVHTFTVWPASIDSTDIVTLREAKQTLGLDQTVITHDVNLAILITAVSDQLDKLVGPVVNRTVTAELHDGGHTTISLDQRPVASVTSITEYNGTAATALTEQTVGTSPVNGYVVDTGGVVHRRSSDSPDAFPSGRSNVTVTYVAGRFDITDEPPGARFKQAALLMLRHIWTSEFASGSETFGGITDGFTNPLLGPGLLNKVIALLNREQDRPFVA